MSRMVSSAAPLSAESVIRVWRLSCHLPFTFALIRTLLQDVFRVTRHNNMDDRGAIPLSHVRKCRWLLERWSTITLTWSQRNGKTADTGRLPSGYNARARGKKNRSDRLRRSERDGTGCALHVEIAGCHQR